MEPQVPGCLRWSCRDVGGWIRRKGFPQYEVIAQLVRDLLGVTEPSWNRSISLPRRDNMGLFLEQKSQTGHNHDLLIYNQFIKEQGL
ncbi:hypothetical protein GDO78_010776 [Eleutherodactylus coqui]|uniref:SAM domain-containing protein n=1 Tax=Eleutherodactylus coqui TaxID=57060 RepID=A0A8J6F556_ELECQ|nr:hypothetical protein GDO78_010776 [Eleutherodactylus coqui]